MVTEEQLDRYYWSGIRHSFTIDMKLCLYTGMYRYAEDKSAALSKFQLLINQSMPDVQLTAIVIKGAEHVAIEFESPEERTLWLLKNS